MRALPLAALATTVMVSACATGPQRFPVSATRFHYDPVTQRGTIAVEPLAGPTSPSIEYKTYAAAVELRCAPVEGWPARRAIGRRPGTGPEYRPHCPKDRGVPQRSAPILETNEG